MKMTRSNKLCENILSLASIRGLEYLLAFIYFPYLVRVLQPEHYGILIFVQGIVQYFVLFTEYGFNFLGPRELARHDSVAERGIVFSNIFYAKLVLLLSGSFVFFTGLYSLKLFVNIDIPLYSISFLVVVANVFFPIWFFQGMQQMVYITIANILGHMIKVLGLFLFVHSSQDYLLAAFFLALGPAIAAVVAWFIILRKYPDAIRRPNIIGIKGSLKEGWSLFTTSVAINIYTASSVVFLGLVTNNITVGYFSGAKRIIDNITQMMMPISQAVYPYVSKKATQSHKDALRFLRKILLILGTGSFVLSCFILFFSQWIVDLLLGPGYEEAVSLLAVMAFMPFLIALSNVFAIQTMLLFGLQKEFNKIALKAAFFNVSLIFPLSYFYGGLGACIALVITEFYVTYASWRGLREKGIYLLKFPDYID